MHIYIYIFLIDKGTIADREHRKWIEEAVNLPNNPYSTENLTKYKRKPSASLNQ